jgi:ribosomal protein L33
MRPVGSNYAAWLDAIKAKYPDACPRTQGEYGWSSLGCDDNGPTLTPHMSGPYWTDVSSRTYSTRLLVGKYDHVADTGVLYAPL